MTEQTKRMDEKISRIYKKVEKLKRKTILHLCADIGSDSYVYEQSGYNVIKVGVDIGVENFSTSLKIYGVIANPVCTEFSTVSGFYKKNQSPDMSILNHCKRIINECNPVWWVIENPANGTMSDYMGKPDYVYQLWWYGSPWTKRTALWGKFNIPKRLYSKWEDIDKNSKLYIRPGRKKPSLAFLHKSAIYDIDEFKPFIDQVDSDNAFRSLCSQGFSKAFYEANK